MNYWILQKASLALCLKGTVAWVDCPLFIIAVAWKTGHEAWKRVVGVVLCVKVGWWLHVQEVINLLYGR